MAMSIEGFDLLNYFETQALLRERDIDDRLSQLTRREWSLVRDAAVMGYVLGRVDQDGELAFPKDSEILTRSVLYATLREPEGYAVLRGAADLYTEPGVEVNDMDDEYTCIDGDGNEYPEHTEGSYGECLRCGAELED